MREQRYFIRKHLLRNDEIHDRTCDHFMDTEETVRILNRYDKMAHRYEDLEIEYKRVHNLLDDFMDITNRLQANTADTSLQMMARDMLRMMGVELKKEEMED